MPEAGPDLHRCAAAKEGHIVRGTARDPDRVLIEVAEALTAAGQAADMMAAALAEASSKAAGLDVPAR